MWVPCQSLVKELSQTASMVRRGNRNCIKSEWRRWLATECKGEVGALGTVHLDTPSPVYIIPTLDELLFLFSLIKSVYWYLNENNYLLP